MSLLTVDAMTVRYGNGAYGVEDLALTVDPGETVALVGPNGGGKTSTLRGIAGFLRSEGVSVTAQRLTFAGDEISRLDPLARMKRGIVLVPERNKVFTDLSVDEQLRLAWSARKRSTYESVLEEALEVFPEVQPHLGRKGGLLSGGQRQMVAIMSAMAASPQLMIVDEVTLGLAPGLVKTMTESLNRLAGAGLTLLIAEQNVTTALALAHHVKVMEAGKVVAAGAPEEIRGNAEILAAYLGASAAGDLHDHSAHGGNGNGVSQP